MPKVLVIESDVASQGLLDALQYFPGFTLLKEQQSANGLRTAVEAIPQLIIVDESMPPLDGIELLPLLRSLTDSPIIVKGAGGRQAAAKAMLQGADVYLVRSVSVNEVLARVHALLSRLVTGREPSEGAYSEVDPEYSDRE